MRISDWSSDVCSSDLEVVALDRAGKALTDGGARDVDLLAGFEDGFHGNDGARREFGQTGRIQAEFFQDAAGFGAGFGVVAGLRQIGRASCRERGCQYV